MAWARRLISPCLLEDSLGVPSKSAADALFRAS
jgi:hypothetical protein